MGRSLLIQQLKDGNEKVFEQIVKSYWPRLYAFANIYVINKEAAKEIVQDTFLVLWSQRKYLEDNTCLITYLMVVGRNKCLNYLKSLQLHTIPIDDLNEYTVYQRSNVYVLEDDSLEILITKELAQAIATSLEKLPAQTKEIFMLSRYNGLKNKEIADQLGISTKSVEYHIKNALKQLKSDLIKDYFTVAICILQFILMKK
ncbi:RNA polymerase sigma-70 factor [Parabacteroides sp. AF18-52]|jgi:RNA polymerase sigma factor, sigma-70 family/RNA polymerase sigma-70 factor, Bacteroides expansion family 1|uniref:RNA polymerase sigma-70 factor n=1 Tax=Parabacteroides sp. AF18-52 TaxID=2292242 RepID=UPI000F0101AF|nr:RNA polymerase sigma-70 factor [Parabacteroides sp. AF18-52]RHR41864.1 RNA polymerase sigma-70 factor [Parabacteroides sp. AF18-52]